MRTLFRAGAAAMLLAIFVVGAQAQTGKRIALVIGNDTYKQSPLKNAGNDARVLDQALQDAGFQTYLVQNGTRQQMDRALGEFFDKIGPDDTALFFFAGHGVQIEDENFLVPVDFEPSSSLSGAKFACVSMAQVLDLFKRKRAKQNIVILDACRTNPVQSQYSLEGGLAKVQNAPKETFIAFSTSPGQTAADNPNGKNSWFTEALADYVSQPNLTIGLDEVFTRVRKRVSDATEGKQTPWTTSSLTGSFYFHPPAGAKTDTDTSLLEKWLGEAVLREQREEWSDAVDMWERILDRKPGGRIEAAAKKQLVYLHARSDAEARYEAGDYTGAATLLKQALDADPFAFSAVLQAANSYLVTDHLPEAIEMLKVMRTRGDSAAMEVANRMLKELAPASDAATSELKAATPPPPAVTEVFPELRELNADPAEGRKYVASNPLDLSRWTKDLKIEVAMPALPVIAALANSAPAVAPQDASPTPGAVEIPTAEAEQVKPINIFHYEVVPTAETRNIRIRRPAGNEDYGHVRFDGSGAPLVYEGKQQSLPATLNLPAGTYEVRGVDAGKVVSTDPLEVKALSTITLEVKKQ